VLAACGPAPRGAGDDTGGGEDTLVDASMADSNGGGGDDGGGDGGDGGGGGGGDGGGGDGGGGGTDAGGGDAPAGVITGGPCMSGQAGKTAYRVRWAQSGSSAYVVYEVNGLPDQTDHTGAYGYQIGFTPQFVDPFLGEGGLQLDGSSFVDIELSTVGVSAITSAKLSIYGRSYNTTASGSFHWQTFDGTGSTPTNHVSNVAPYQWYAGDMTTEISPGDNGVLIRIKAGPNSGALVVNRIEICMQAD
jgi:hypothetical protein